MTNASDRRARSFVTLLLRCSCVALRYVAPACRADAFSANTQPICGAGRRGRGEEVYTVRDRPVGSPDMRVLWSRRVPGLRLRLFSSGQPLVMQVGAEGSDELICAPDGLVSVFWGYCDHLLVITLLTKFKCPVQ